MAKKLFSSTVIYCNPFQGNQIQPVNEIYVNSAEHVEEEWIAACCSAA
jgi:hypothetical protein